MIRLRTESNPKFSLGGAWMCAPSVIVVRSTIWKPMRRPGAGAVAEASQRPSGDRRARLKAGRAKSLSTGGGATPCAATGSARQVIQRHSPAAAAAVFIGSSQEHRITA